VNLLVFLYFHHSRRSPSFFNSQRTN